MTDHELSLDSLETVIPQWLRQEGKPPWIPQVFWDGTSTEDKDAILEGQRQALQSWLTESPGRLEWNEGAQKETIKVFFQGIQEEGQLVKAPLLNPDYGMGVAGEWIDLQAQNARAAQYLDISFLGRGYTNRHPNLCGQLTVAGLLGLGLREGLEIYKNADKEESELVKGLKKGKPTGFGELKKFFAAATEDGLQTSFLAVNKRPPNDHAQDNPEALQSTLNAGIKVIALVNIISGILEKLGPTANINVPHWVGVLDIMKPRQGEHLVRVYNPYRNQEEYYTWTTFKDAWEATRGNTSRFGMIIVRPVDDDVDDPVI